MSNHQRSAADAQPLVDPGVAGRVLSRLMSRGGDFGELYAEHRSGLSLSLDDSKIEQVQHGSERGVGLRLVVGDATYFGHVDSLAEPDLFKVADSVAQAARGASADLATLAAATAVPSQLIVEPPDAVAVAEKADLLRKCDETARAFSAFVEQVSVGYAESRRVVTIYNSEGLATGDDRSRLRLSVQVVARNGDRVETGTQTRGGHAGFELLRETPESVATEAAERAVTLLDGQAAPAGVMPVVVGNGFGGVLLHEAVGHGLESDAVQKQASVFAGRIGDRLAGDFVTAFDDGRKPGEWGTDGIDDEGTPTQKTPIIQGGQLESYLYDLLRARKDNVASTGNGRRESFRHLPVPRMTNTYFAPGTATPEELIASVDKGVYAVSFGGGQVEPATGDFVFGVSEGYLIEGGRVTAPLRGVTLVGNGIAALASIEALAGDLEIATGFCGKGGQRVAAGVGQPHVLIRELTVGGTAA